MIGSNNKKKIFREILDGVDPSWSCIEKARYIYYQLGKCIIFNPEYMFNSTSERIKSIFYKKVDINVPEDVELVCNTASDIYIQLLAEVGVKARKVTKPGKIKKSIDVRDVAVVFYDENDDEYFTNVLGDIENCRFDCETEFFGITKTNYEGSENVKSIPQHKLKDIDIKVHNIKEDYAGSLFFSILAEEIKSSDNFKSYLQSLSINTDGLSDFDIQRLKMDFANRIIRFNDRNAGPSERKLFYKKFLRESLFDKLECKRMKPFEFLKRENGVPVDSIDVIELDLEDCPVYYVFDEDKSTLIQIIPEDLLERIDGYTETHNKHLLIEDDGKNYIPV